MVCAHVERGYERLVAELPREAARCAHTVSRLMLASGSTIECSVWSDAPTERAFAGARVHCQDPRGDALAHGQRPWHARLVRARGKPLRLRQVEGSAEDAASRCCTPSRRRLRRVRVLYIYAAHRQDANRVICVPHAYATPRQGIPSARPGGSSTCAHMRACLLKTIPRPAASAACAY